MATVTDASPRIHRIDPGHAPDVAKAPHLAPSPTVSTLALGGWEWRVEAWTDAQWAEIPEADRPADVTRASSDNGWSRILPPERAEESAGARALREKMEEAGRTALERMASEKAERERRQAEGARAMARRLVDEAASRFEDAAATVEQLERGESDGIDLDFAGEKDFTILARRALRDSERDLGRRMIGALPYLAPGLAARDDGGFLIPFGVASGGTMYLLAKDVQDRGTGIIVRVPLDRIATEAPATPGSPLSHGVRVKPSA